MSSVAEGGAQRGEGDKAGQQNAQPAQDDVAARVREVSLANLRSKAFVRLRSSKTVLSPTMAEFLGYRLGALFADMAAANEVFDYSKVNDLGLIKEDAPALHPIDERNSFKFFDRDKTTEVLTLVDMVTTLRDCTPQALHHYVGKGTNHLANWVRDCFHDQELAKQLDKAKYDPTNPESSRKYIMDTIGRRVFDKLNISIHSPVVLKISDENIARRNHEIAMQQQNVERLFYRLMEEPGRAIHGFRQGVETGRCPVVFEGGSDVLDLMEPGLGKTLKEAVQRRGLTEEAVNFQVVFGRGRIPSNRIVGSVRVLNERFDDIPGVSPLAARMPKDGEVQMAERTAALGVHPFVVHHGKYLYQELLPTRVKVDDEYVDTSLRERGVYLDRDERRSLGFKIARTIGKGIAGNVLFDVDDTEVIVYDVHERANGGRVKKIRVGFPDKTRARDISPDTYRKTLADPAKYTDEGYNRWRDKEAVNNLKSWFLLVRRALNINANVDLWGQVEQNLCSNYAITNTVEGGRKYRRLLDRAYDELRDPKSWDGDAQKARDFGSYLRRIKQAEKGRTFPEKPQTLVQRLSRELTDRGVNRSHARAIIEDLEDKVNEKTFSQLRFTVKRRKGGAEEHYTISVEPRDTALPAIGTYTVTTAEAAKIKVVRFASENDLSDDLVYAGNGVIVQFRPSIRMSMPEAVKDLESITNPEWREESFRQMGRVIARKTINMMHRDIFIVREQKEFYAHLKEFDYMRVVGEGNMLDVTFNGWDGERLNINESTMPTAFAQSVRETAGLCAAIGENGGFVFAEFEKNLLTYARTQTMRNVAAKSLEETKKQMIRDYDRWAVLFDKAKLVKKETNLPPIPDDIKTGLEGCGVKNVPIAWSRMITMMAPNEREITWLGFEPEEAAVKRNELIREMTPTAVRVLERVRECGFQDPDGAIRNLRDVCEIHAEAMSRINRYQGMPASAQVSGEGNIMHMLAEDTEAARALGKPERDAIAVSDVLADRGPFLAKLLLETIAENPKSLQSLMELKTTIPTVETGPKLDEEARRRVDEAGKGAESRGFEESCKARIEALREFHHETFIKNVGYLYTEAMRGKLTWDNVSSIYDGLTTLNKTLLKHTAAIAYDVAVQKHGKPGCGWAIIEGGAGARNEFPTFDRDITLVYGKDGSTGNGESHQAFFKEMTNELSRMLRVVGQKPDFSLSVRDVPTTVDEFMEKLKSPEKSWTAKAYITVEPQAGDMETSGRIIEAIREYVNNVRRDIVLSQLYFEYVKRPEEDNYDERNIKWARGGLRDVVEIAWLHKVRSQDPDNRTVELLKHLEKEVLESCKGESKSAQQKRKMWADRIGKMRDAYLGIMNVRINMDFHYGSNDKNLPTDDQELDRFSRALGYVDQDTMDGKTATEQFMKEYFRNTKTVKRVVEAIIQWMFKPEELKKMMVEGKRYDKDTRRAVAFAGDGTPLMQDDLKPKSQTPMSVGSGEVNADGEVIYVKEEDRPPEVNRALAILRGTLIIDPETGKERIITNADKERIQREAQRLMDAEKLKKRDPNKPSWQQREGD